MRPATVAVQAGRSLAPGADVNPAIAMSVTFRHGGDRLYGRDDNDTWEAFEAALGELEGGHALTFSSGMAAISAVLETLPIGATVIVAAGAYNGTRKWVLDAVSRGRLVVRFVDITDAAATIAACAGAAMVWLESPTNPCLDVGDLAGIAAGAHAHGTSVVVDNTIATPLLQRPLALGADVVVHSVTKWLGGHSDLLMGATVAGSVEWLETLRGRRTLYGGVPGSLEAWLALRGLRSLPARLDRAQATAGILAARLLSHPAVTRVRYPGLECDPGFAVASTQMDGPGGMVSFEVIGGALAAERVCASVAIFTHATSLGDVASLIERRGRYAFEEEVPPALLRMSIGQEDVEDLWEDLDAALRSATE